MQHIHYDFSNIVLACADIIDSDGRKGLEKLKYELNKFFRDSKCREILFTRSDTMFFGMCIIPEISQDMIVQILQDDNKVRFSTYSIEIDSKILHPALSITPEEMTAMLLHEIGHLVNDPVPVDEVRKAIGVYLIKNGDALNIPKTAQYYTILAYGIKDAVRKMTSMLYVYKDSEVLADEFVHVCGFGGELNSIFDKICKSRMKINDPTINKLTALTWSIRLYKELKIKRIPALKLLNKMKSITGSKLEKRELERIESAIRTIDDSAVNECMDFFNPTYYTYICESTGEVKQTRFARLRRESTIKSIKRYENDLYEYKMRIRHVADEDDAYYLIRCVNERISVMEDFLEHERLSETEHKRYWKLLERYYSLREELANNVSYKYDYSNSLIVVNYPEIKAGRH